MAEPPLSRGSSTISATATARMTFSTSALIAWRARSARSTFQKIPRKGCFWRPKQTYYAYARTSRWVKRNSRLLKMGFPHTNGYLQSWPTYHHRPHQHSHGFEHLFIKFEADDALASAAAKGAQDDRVRQVIICTPDKDLSQCVVGSRVVQLDRRRETLRDEAGVIAKFGIKPSSIPDYLAVVGDSADGYPGIAGWGAKTAAAVFWQYPHLEDIPKDWNQWVPMPRRARPLAQSLFAGWEDALLFRTLATLRVDVPVFASIDDLRWRGPAEDFKRTIERLKAPDLFRRALARNASQTI
jgi:hypothetical protein